MIPFVRHDSLRREMTFFDITLISATDLRLQSYFTVRKGKHTDHLRKSGHFFSSDACV